jgi:hypothetical protein
MPDAGATAIIAVIGGGGIILAIVGFFIFDVPGRIKEFFSSSESSAVEGKSQTDFANYMKRRKNSRRRKSRKAMA